MRDALVGDVLTSVVRVLLDVAFTLLYSLYWLKGIITWQR